MNFKTWFAGVMDRAVDEARHDRSATVEAQHLLLAVLPFPDLPLPGLDHDAFRAALDREFEHSLSTVGVSATAFDVASASPDPDRKLHPGASVQLALDRAMRAAGRSAPRPGHLLIGILSAEAGTVPRALDQAGVDRAALLAQVRESLS
ncbi:Clp protease N-terminal domain-containing protein [Actinoplanes sp. NPDC049265]|uniref:Clp protease N-terminal domain-containing protein n=1 Tax=Actinoplanes sp. NPDC049265 TaxID=3363902 RepID=UPI0037231E19